MIEGGSYELYGEGANGSVSYGTVVVNTDGSVKITFNDAIRTLGNATGSFHFTAEFNKDAINTPGDHEIKIPNDPANIHDSVNFKSNIDQAIDKSGEPDKLYNPGSISWTVDFNKPVDTLHNAVLSDTIPEGLEITGVHVYTIGVDVAGNIIDDSQDDYNGAYTVDPDGTVHFSDPITSAMRVVYDTDITADTTGGGSINFVNNATLTSDDTNSLTTNATVTARYGDFLNKRNTGYDPVTQEFTWEIRYNYGQQLIPKADATLTDVLYGAGMVFDPDSIVIRPVSIDDNGAGTPGDAMTSGYDVNINGTEMTITFDQDLDHAVIITYKTKINGIIDADGATYGNDVTTVWGGHAHDSGDAKPVLQQNIIKSRLNANEVLQQVSWLIDINLSRYTMRNWSMTDTLGTGLHLVDENLIAIRDMTDQTTLQLGTDYTLDVANDQTFTLTFLGDYKTETDHAFQVIYYTHYDETAPSIVTNSATSHWTDTNGGPHDSTTHAEYPRTPVDIDNGEKYGVYNAMTKEITWYILGNYHVYDVHPAVLVDPIQGDQVYVPDSLRFYAYQQGVQPESGVEINANEIGLIIDPPSESNNQTLTVSYDGNDQQQTLAIWGVFRTSLAGQFIDESHTYDNDATLTTNDIVTNLHGEVTVAHGGELLLKSGTQDRSGYASWNVTINPSQRTLTDVVVTDTPSVNQRIDMNSVALYRTTVDAAGNITATNQRLVAGTDYTVTYAANASGVWEMVIRFPGTIDSAYVLEYRASIYMAGDALTGTVTNDVRLDSATNSTTGGESPHVEFPVHVVEGGGVIFGKAASVTVRKVDENGDVLPGAVLLLKDNPGNSIGPMTVGASGEVTFDHIVSGTYTLYELAAPTGYTISQALASGIPIAVNDNTTNKVNIIEAVNALTSVQFRKVDDKNNPLAGAAFRLDLYDPLTDTYAPYNNETYTSGSDGIIRVTGLPAGQYRFVETAAPDGYIRNVAGIDVTLTADAQGVIAPFDAGDIINYRATLRLTKTNPDDNDAPLAGAVFSIRAENGDEIGTYTTGPDGIATIPDLSPGVYSLHEITAPPGYALVSDPWDITIPDAVDGDVPVLNIGTVHNTRALGSVIFQKVDGDTSTGLSGAVFDLINTDTGETVQQVTTIDSGWGIISGLTLGNYSLVEVTSPEGYILNSEPLDFTATQAEYDLPYPQFIGTLNNYQGRARILKTDDDGAPLSGATFTLYDEDGTAMGEFTTDPDGAVEIYQLAPGDYTLRETRAPTGFELFPAPIPFTVPDSSAGETPTVRLSPLSNTRMLGAVSIRKEDAQTGVTLSGAVFDLIRSSDNTVVTRVTTDATGIATVSGLEAGSYRFVEITPPTGYALDATPIPFQIIDGESDVLVEVTARDSRLPGEPTPTPTPSPRPTLPPDGPPKTSDDGNGPWGTLLILSAVVFLGAFTTWIIGKRKPGKKTQ